MPNAAAKDQPDPIEPYRRRCSEAKDCVRVATAHVMQARKRLADFVDFTNSRPAERLRVLETARASSGTKLKQAEAQLAAVLARQKQAEAALSSVFNVSKWFSSEEKQRKEVASAARTEAAAATVRLAEKRSDAENAKQTEQALRSEIEHWRYATLQQLKNDAEAAGEQLQERESAYRVAKDAMSRIEERCGPLTAEHARLVGERSRRRALVADAEWLDHKLSTDRDNAKHWHQQSQARLGNSSPGYFLRDARRELRGVERDLDKLTRRLADTVRLADLQIEEIVLDGLNLCYEDRRFVGLGALTSLARALAARHAVVVYLDSDARSLLRLNDRAIADRFDSRVRVRVTPTGTKADELLLRHAQDRPDCFVISNDRFGDYPDMAAVRERRILRHEIADGRVTVPDLQLSAAYR